MSGQMPVSQNGMSSCGTMRPQTPKTHTKITDSIYALTTGQMVILKIKFRNEISLTESCSSTFAVMPQQTFGCVGMWGLGLLVDHVHAGADTQARLFFFSPHKTGMRTAVARSLSVSVNVCRGAEALFPDQGKHILDPFANEKKHQRSRAGSEGKKNRRDA